jgi:ABC-type Fe3+ transport system permease subunit
MNDGLAFLIRFIRETGILGQLSVTVFLAGSAFAAWIHFRRLGFRYRVALIPLSLLPFMMGVFGLAIGIIRIIYNYSQGSVRPDAGWWLLGDFVEPLQIIPLTSMESIILLVVSALLFIGRNFPIAEVPREQGEPPNDR